MLTVMVEPGDAGRVDLATGSEAAGVEVGLDVVAGLSMGAELLTGSVTGA
ncbi:MAG: hypothetical protein ACO25G_00255 [Holophagaceae bacterium]